MNMNELPEGEDLLAELEESIPQGVPNDTGFRRRATDPVTEDTQIDSLEALLSESVTAVERERQHKADVEARRKGFVGMTKEEVDFCNSRLHAFEMARVWNAEYAISVWHIYECQNCGRDRMVFSRLMEFHRSKVNPSTNRWVTVADTELEANPVKEIRPVPTCPRCSEWELDPRLMVDLKEVL